MNAALLELINDQHVQNLVYKKNTALALIPKRTDFGGKYKPIPIITGASQGRSATFTTAQTNQSAPQIESFLLTSKSDYSLGTIDGKTLAASATDQMSFLRGSQVSIDGAIRSITLSLASSMFRTGTGTIGAIATGGITSGVITLASAPDVVQFEVNMVLQANATDGGTPRAALGYVIAVDRGAGTVTVATSAGGSAGSPAGWTAGDSLLVQGDNNAKISGFPAWLPATAPTSSDNFYGVNRSADVTRLAGIRYDGSSQPIEEALIDASMLVGREGGTPSHGFYSYASHGALDKALGAKVQYVDLVGSGNIGFRGIRVNGADSEIKMMPDRNCPGLRAYLLQLDTWCLESLGEAPHIAKYGSDGNEMLRVYNADAGEVRVRYYANMSNNAPGWNCNVTLGA